MKLTRTITAAVAAVGVTAAVAVAATQPTVKASSNAALGRTIAVDAKKGMTLYYLTGDRKGHVLCASSTCTGFWPPLTVKSLHTKVKVGKGINGPISVFKRPDGRFQVMLRNKPLYRFAGDAAKGQANGEGIVNFGGTWHAIPARGY